MFLNVKKRNTKETVETTETGSAEAMRTLKRINGAVDASRQKIKETKRVSTRMARIAERAQLIDEIAGLTNILVLNVNI